MFEIILENWLLILSFFLVAMLYAAVGFGGGSSYLAILTLTSITFTEIRIIALLCNIVVVFGNVVNYLKDKKIEFKKVFPLVLISVPMAYLGGFLKISETFFFILLGFSLLFAAITMWISKKFIAENEVLKMPNLKQNFFFGGIIGFISGMVGIGGGIFLAPLLHLTKWDTPKKIAATSSVFILVNSFAGIIGQTSSKTINMHWHLTFILLIAVLLGGQIGNTFSSKYISPILLKKATAILIAFISIRLLLKYLN